MSDYKQQSNGYVLRARDGVWIPPIGANADWQDYQAWLAAGGVPDPVDPPPAPDSPP